ncbi:MAG: MinD/ParA family protein [Fibrobacter sp.]|jgi:flagellar biosynthesis protein FlhG|nr:MinD/ParA family protein [Fibrobacter sp.]
MKEPIIISIGGGKGGVGKSTISANIGTALSQKGFNVGFIDADLGGANLHLCLGVKRPRVGLQDFIKGNYKSLNEVAVPTLVEKSWLISGASDILELANPNFAQKQKIINNLKKLDADYILVDLGAGSSFHVTDFFAAFPYGIIVTDGLPTSIENAYGYLKNGIIRGMVRLFPGKTELQNRIKNFSDPQSKKEFTTVNDLLNHLKNDYSEETLLLKQWLHKRRSFLVLNMVKNADDIKIGTRFAEMVKKYLSINLYYIGYIMFAPEIRASIKEMRPFMLKEEPSRIRDCFEAVSQNLISITRGSV